MPHWFYPAVIVAIPLIGFAWLWLAAGRKEQAPAAERPCRGED
jgi:hypothetical protein